MYQFINLVHFQLKTSLQSNVLTTSAVWLFVEGGSQYICQRIDEAFLEKEVVLLGPDFVQVVLLETQGNIICQPRQCM